MEVRDKILPGSTGRLSMKTSALLAKYCPVKVIFVVVIKLRDEGTTVVKLGFCSMHPQVFKLHSAVGPQSLGLVPQAAPHCPVMQA